MYSGGRSNNHYLKIIIGIAISFFFLFLAIRKIDVTQMKQAFSVANYWYIFPSIVIIFISHWFRSLRWKLLTAPLKQMKAKDLFSSLLIGYSANTVLPAHLGEFLRAYTIGRKYNVAMPSVFATIVTERIIDILSLIAIMILAFLLFPFPTWVKNSGILLSSFTLGLLLLFLLSRKYQQNIYRLFDFLFKPFKVEIKSRVTNLFASFFDGVQPLKKTSDYLSVVILSCILWICYLGVFYISFYTFDLIQTYNLNFTAAVVLLVITTISLVVPSSPGYIGTYHWLCQVSLELFSVPGSVGLSFAILLHLINFFPVFIVGFILAWKEGISFTKEKRNSDHVCLDPFACNE